MSQYTKEHYVTVQKIVYFKKAAVDKDHITECQSKYTAVVAASFSQSKDLKYKRFYSLFVCV